MMTTINDIPLESKKKKLEYYRDNPIAFFTDVLDVKKEHIWSKMNEMCCAIRDNRKVAIKAGHSVSKSYSVARVVLWYLYCFPPCTVITTAPTNTQVEEILWREIHQAHTNARVPLGGHITQTQLDLSKTVKNKNIKWFAFGFSTRPDTVDGNATKMQGYHNKNMIVVFDEADGVLPPIWNACDGLLTNDNVKFVAIGNPMRPTGNFSDCFSDPTYHKITISVKDTPNYIEGREVIPGVSGRTYVDDMMRKWGEKSNIFRSRVLGEIPDADPLSIIPLSWYERAEGNELDDLSGVVKIFLTVDVADGGDDCTVVKGWKNKTQISENRYPGKRADEVYPDVLRNLKEIDGTAIVYDNDGCGRILGGLLEGIIDKNIVEIIPFTGSDTRFIDTDFFNRRAEGHFAMFKDFRDNKISIFSNNDRCKEDLTSVRWGESKRNKMLVEPKKDLKRRISRSPDDGDCVMMMSACYDEVKPIEIKDRWKEAQKRQNTLYDDSNNDWMCA